MRDFVIGEATALFCKGGQLKDAMEAVAIEFPGFGFKVLSHNVKGLMVKIQKAEEGEMEEQEEDEDGDGEPIQQVKLKRYSMRTKAAPKKRVVEVGSRSGSSTDLSGWCELREPLTTWNSSHFTNKVNLAIVKSQKNFLHFSARWGFQQYLRLLSYLRIVLAVREQRLVIDVD